ncbi:MAG: LysR substrate-binding domain-containing protein [Geminicoccaceae bacterium]|nr:LysR substrate-binding domain-containing protein [Geminicoccaceae bacterium]
MLTDPITNVDGAPVLDPDLLASFVAVAEAGGFTEAAARVHRTQSAVSMQIKRLEERLGRALFERSARGAVLTPSGELLLPHARSILEAHRKALALFAEDPVAGRVVVGAPDDYAATFLPASLARFAETHPKVEVELVVAPSAELVPALERPDGPDLALVTAGCGERAATILRREALVWVAAVGHEIERRDPLPLALFHSGCAFRRAALSALAASGRRYRIAYTSVSLAGVLAAVKSGFAVGVVLRASLVPGLRVLGSEEGLPELPAMAIALARAEHRRSAAADALARHLAATLASAPDLAAA